jgi:hypothetical protein
VTLCTPIVPPPGMPVTATSASPPAPIRPAPAYVPASGDTVRLVYRHEDGRTTQRVVDVRRVGRDRALGPMFRGFDRTYNRTRNYYLCHIVRIEPVGTAANARAA